VRSALVILIAVTACLPSSVRATDERTILAVLPLRNVMQKSELDWMSEGFAETITSKLNYVKSLRLVERVQLGEIIKEQKLSLTDLTEDDATRVGRLLNASFKVCSVKIIGNLRCEGVRRCFVFLPPVLKSVIPAHYVGDVIFDFAECRGRP